MAELDKHEAAKLLTEGQRAALHAEPCGICEQPYHRFCDHDPEHEWNAIACINSLLAEVERLRGVVEAIDPAKLLEVTSWFDLVDELLDVCFVKETSEGAILLAGSGDLTPLRARLKGPRDEIQSDLRRWSAALAALEEGE